MLGVAVRETKNVERFAHIFVVEMRTVVGDAEAVAQCASILNGPCLLATEGDGLAPSLIKLIGMEKAVRLSPSAGGMEAIVLHRDDPDHTPLPRVIAASGRIEECLWLPLGLEVNLP